MNLAGVCLLASVLTEAAPESSWVPPVKSTHITSEYGSRVHPVSKRTEFHNGIDLRVSTGSRVSSVGFGQVVFAGRYAGYGTLVVVLHGQSISSHYAHCDSTNVRVGDWVRAGQKIAESGSSGRSTGPHLHFELRRSGMPADPSFLFENNIREHD